VADIKCDIPGCVNPGKASIRIRIVYESAKEEVLHFCSRAHHDLAERMLRDIMKRRGGNGATLHARP
jgi:hypothetical protein